MKKVLMTASESSHFKNFHIPYISKLIGGGTVVHTAANGDFSLEGAVHTQLKFRKKITSPANIAVIFRLARLIGRERFDAVYTNSTLAGFAGRMAVLLSGSRKTQCRHICHGYLFDDDGSLRSRIYLAFEKLVRRRTELLAVMNEDDLRIAEKYKLGREIVFLDGMGLDASKFPELPEDEITRRRAELGAENGGYLFLCVGEFSPRKNQSVILKAFARLGRTDCRLVFAGSGALLEDCRALAGSLGIADRTVFLGHCTEMNILYRACDCLISASRYEGLPFNVMEALYCGESVLLSNVKGNRDLADSSELYPYNDDERLAALMETARSAPRVNRLPERYLLSRCLDKNAELLRYI
ncbi:MAG: glycosyltransferase [Oscillospiraceae bacterium]|nr:glycosyltransferase [Oscillospiraceae bacterium]